MGRGVDAPTLFFGTTLLQSASYDYSFDKSSPLVMKKSKANSVRQKAQIDKELRSWKEKDVPISKSTLDVLTGLVHFHEGRGDESYDILIDSIVSKDYDVNNLDETFWKKIRTGYTGPSCESVVDFSFFEAVRTDSGRPDLVPNRDTGGCA